MYSTTNAGLFVDQWNKLDKYLEHLINPPSFINYGEKLRVTAKSDFSISPFVAKRLPKFKYFGEIRNQITHGVQIDGQDYIIPADHAVTEIAKFVDYLYNLPLAIHVCRPEVVIAQASEALHLIIRKMWGIWPTHIPVYRDAVLVGVLSTSSVCERVAQHINNDADVINSDRVVGDVSLHSSRETYHIVGPSTNIYQMESLREHHNTDQRLGCVIVTEDGTHSSKILTIVTVDDIPLLRWHFLS